MTSEEHAKAKANARARSHYEERIEFAKVLSPAVYLLRDVVADEAEPLGIRMEAAEQLVAALGPGWIEGEYHEA